MGGFESVFCFVWHPAMWGGGLDFLLNNTKQMLRRKKNVRKEAFLRTACEEGRAPGWDNQGKPKSCQELSLF